MSRYLLDKKGTRACTQNSIKHFVSCKHSNSCLHSLIENRILSCKHSNSCLHSLIENRILSCKHSAIGEAVINIYRILLIAFIAFIIFGVAAFVYDYYINVRQVEAQILSEQVVNCLVQDSVLNLDKLAKNADYNLLEACGIENSERFYVDARVAWDVPPGADPDLDSARKAFEEGVKNNMAQFLAPDGSLDTNKYLEERSRQLSKFTSRELQQGDSGKGWIKEINENAAFVDSVGEQGNPVTTVNLASVPLFKGKWGKYFPGIIIRDYKLNVQNNNKIYSGSLYLEVLVDYEF